MVRYTDTPVFSIGMVLYIISFFRKDELQQA